MGPHSGLKTPLISYTTYARIISNSTGRVHCGEEQKQVKSTVQNKGQTQTRGTKTRLLLQLNIWPPTRTGKRRSNENMYRHLDMK